MTDMKKIRAISLWSTYLNKCYIAVDQHMIKLEPEQMYFFY